MNMILKLLVLALVVVVAIWVLGLVLGALALPPLVGQIVYAILVVVFLIKFLQIIGVPLPF